MVWQSDSLTVYTVGENGLSLLTQLIHKEYIPLSTVRCQLYSVHSYYFIYLFIRSWNNSSSWLQRAVRSHGGLVLGFHKKYCWCTFPLLCHGCTIHHRLACMKSTYSHLQELDKSGYGVVYCQVSQVCHVLSCVYCLLSGVCSKESSIKSLLSCV